MIELIIEGCCKDCRYKDLSFHHIADIYWIECSHQEVCGKLEKEEQKGANDNCDYERAAEHMEHYKLYEPTYNPEDGSM